MRTLTSSFRFTVATAVLVPCLALAWTLGVPDAFTPLSYALFAGLLSALTAIALMTYRNGQTTASVAQVLQDAESAGPSTTRGVRRAASQFRPLA
jgi:fructose-specific phosphotransferase system IIC component